MFPKTAGTEINGELVMHFERVCGNKGYSYDALLATPRFEEILSQGNLQGEYIRWNRADMGDTISKAREGHNRGNVPLKAMKEIGFDDCDYIAHKGHTDQWLPIADEWPLELHVPCRKPLNHLMSTVNYVHLSFDCNATNLRAEVMKAVGYTSDRFNSVLFDHPNIYRQGTAIIWGRFCNTNVSKKSTFIRIPTERETKTRNAFGNSN